MNPEDQFLTTVHEASPSQAWGKLDPPFRGAVPDSRRVINETERFMDGFIKRCKVHGQLLCMTCYGYFTQGPWMSHARFMAAKQRPARGIEPPTFLAFPKREESP